MTIKVKIITGDDSAALETATNAFLADKDPANVLAVQAMPTLVGSNVELAFHITYQE